VGGFRSLLSARRAPLEPERTPAVSIPFSLYREGGGHTLATTSQNHHKKEILSSRFPKNPFKIRIPL